MCLCTHTQAYTDTTSACTHLHVRTHMHMRTLRCLSSTPEQLNEISETGMHLEHRFLKGPPGNINRQRNREPLTWTRSQDLPALKTLGS